MREIAFHSCASLDVLRRSTDALRDSQVRAWPVSTAA
jgi:hypothetical protein